MNKRQKIVLIRIIFSVVSLIFAAAYMLFYSIGSSLKLIFFLVIYMVAGYDVIFNSFKSLLKFRFFDENFLMFMATAGAIFLQKYFEAVFVVLLYQIGELFQNFVVCHSKKLISSLFDVNSDYVNLKTESGFKKIDPCGVKIGDFIVVKPGEKIPLDGVIVSGNTVIDASSMTGEPAPKNSSVGDEVVSGCINMTGLIEIKVSKIYDDSVVKKVIDLIENAPNKKAKTEKFFSNFAKIYTPLIIIFSVLLFMFSIIIVGDLWQICFERVLIFLVISCPCALVVSIPMSFFGGLAKAAKNGILIKSGICLEELSKANIVIFDKTGTLTIGKFCVTEVNAKNFDFDELIEIIVAVEQNSNHPIAVSISNFYAEKKFNSHKVSNFKEIAGLGVAASVDGKQVQIGNFKLMEKFKILCFEKKASDCIDSCCTIYVAVNGKNVGNIVLSDKIKPEVSFAIKSLKENGIEEIGLFTGDIEKSGNKLASKLNLDFVFCNLLPFEKVEKLKYFSEIENKKNKIIFVGDGVNDAPVMLYSDIGIAMGTIGSDAALEAADVVLMGDDLEKIPFILKISKKTMRIVFQNIVLSLGIKFLIILLLVFGFSDIWIFAIFSDVGITIMATLNALRTI